MIDFRLQELLQELRETQTSFALRTNLARQTISKLYAKKAQGIEFATLEKICRALKIQISEILVLELAGLEKRIAESPEVHFAVGARCYDLRSNDRFGIGFEDLQGASAINEDLAFVAKRQLPTRHHMFPVLDDFRHRDWPDSHGRAERLLGVHGLLVVLGSDLVNGFAPYLLDKILDVGEDSRGKKRPPIRTKLPYLMAWGHKEKEELFMALQGGPHKPQGIWDVRAGELLIEIPKREVVNRIKDQSCEITNGAIVSIDPPNQHHPQCLVLGIAGFGGPGTAITSEKIFETETLEQINELLDNASALDYQRPLFLAAKVTYSRDGRTKEMEFVGSSYSLDA